MKQLAILMEEVKGLQVLLFPSRQFGFEYGSTKTIEEVVKGYSEDFKVYKVINVNGDNTHPVYHYLRQCGQLNQEDGICGGITWNFSKFLVDGDGKVVKYYFPDQDPIDIKPDFSELIVN